VKMLNDPSHVEAGITQYVFEQITVGMLKECLAKILQAPVSIQAEGRTILVGDAGERSDLRAVVDVGGNFSAASTPSEIGEQLGKLEDHMLASGAAHGALVVLGRSEEERFDWRLERGATKTRREVPVVYVFWPHPVARSIAP
jgi:hypothetical protein